MMNINYKLLADWLHQIDMDKEEDHGPSKSNTTIKRKKRQPTIVYHQTPENLILALKECCRELRIENIKLRKENRRLKEERRK